MAITTPEADQITKSMWSAAHNAETLHILKGSTGSMVIYYENGHIVANRPLGDDQIVISMPSVVELLTAAGYTVTAPEEVTHA